VSRAIGRREAFLTDQFPPKASDEFPFGEEICCRNSVLTSPLDFAKRASQFVFAAPLAETRVPLPRKPVCYTFEVQAMNAAF
jgi:hypothetical protein